MVNIGIICDSGSFAVQFGDHFRSGDHLRSGIICGAVHVSKTHVLKVPTLHMTQTCQNTAGVICGMQNAEYNGCL